MSDAQKKLVHDPATHKLGMKPALRRPTLFQLADFLAPTLPKSPPSCSYSDKVADWGMMYNDRYGDCTIAGRGHQHLLRTTLKGSADMPTDESILAAYVAVTGAEGAAFNPETGENDNGCALEDVLDYYRKQGIIGASCYLDPLNDEHVKFTINAFESAYVGVGLPIASQSQNVWDIPEGQEATGDWEPGSWGGHCVILVDYGTNADGSLKTVNCITWGGIKTMTARWWKTYADPKQAYGEAHAVVSTEMVAGTSPAPSGFDMTKLQSYLAALKTKQ